MMIGAKLVAARKAMGLTQEQMAEKLDVTAQAVSTWERNDNLPDLKKLILLCNVLKTTPNALLSKDDTDWKLKITDQQPLLDRAIEFATVKHSGVTRKSTTIPYISHVMEAMEIVSRMTDDEEVRAAAVLHDTLEDTDTKKEELIQYFGSRVADLVAAESEDKREGQPETDTWETRKRETIRHLSNASTEIKMIALGDKLSNVRAMSRDYKVIGEKLWERFNQKNPVFHGMYYGQLANIFGHDEMIRNTPEYREYVTLCSELFSREYDGDGNLIGDEDEEIVGGKKLNIQFMPLESARKVKNREKINMLILDEVEEQDFFQIQLMAMVVDAFLRTEETGFRNVHLQLTNDPDSDDVAWTRTDDGYAIHLCVESGKNWCQSAYQLGYAMTHCLIDHLKKDGPAVTWAEELICEAAALEILYQLIEHWDETPFAQEDPDYWEAIKEYLDMNLKDQGTSALIRCGSLNELKSINERNTFDDRIDESHDLFRTFAEGDLTRMVQIRKYAANSEQIYTHYWRALSDDSKAIDYLCRLQERIPGCEIPAGIHQEINLENSNPSKKQIQSYGQMIRLLRPLPLEYVIFNFLDSDKEDFEQIGLVFYQVTREKGGELDVEMRIDTRKGRKMYQKFMDDDGAANTLMDILKTNELPDLEGWKDITEAVFGKNEIPQRLQLLTEIRNHPENFLPLVDHIGWHYKSRTDDGDVNIGWNIGLLNENRPWFAECWATEGITVLTYYIATKGIEEKSAAELASMLEEAGVVKRKDQTIDPTVQKFTDGNGNEFFSINLTVGIEDESYITKDGGYIYSFMELNRFNGFDDETGVDSELTVSEEKNENDDQS